MEILSRKKFVRPTPLQYGLVGFAFTLLWQAFPSVPSHEDMNSYPFYNEASEVGRAFRTLSVGLSESSEFTFRVVPVESVNFKNAGGVLTEEGYRFVKSFTPQALQIDPDRGAEAYLYTTSDSSALCVVAIHTETGTPSYLRLIRGDASLQERFSMLHELGHCAQLKYDMGQYGLGDEYDLKKDLSQVVGGNFRSLDDIQGAPQGGLRGLQERLIREAFADVYAFTHLVAKDGYDPEFVLNNLLAKRRMALAKQWGFRYNTQPFLLLAYKERNSIASYAGIAEFTQEILLANQDVWHSSAIVNFVAMNLLSQGFVTVDDVVDKARVKEAYRITNHYLGDGYRLSSGDVL